MAAGWGLVEFTNYLVDRYVLSPYLPDLALLTWALMVPTVLMLAYFHGRPGRDAWTSLEKVGIPANVILAGALLLYSFAGKDLGAATIAVTLEDETGTSVERIVPKSEFRKRAALFYFDNQSADTAFDWLQYGLVFALYNDLRQDQFISVQFGPDFIQRFKEADFRDGLKLPLTLKREISHERHLDYFVTGKIDRSGEGLTITTQLYETRRGKLLKERSFYGNDPLAMVDEITVQLKRDLEIPAQHIEDSPDLPAAEQLTSSPEAFRQFIDGIYALTVSEDWRSAEASLRQAITDDPSFATAHAVLFTVYTVINDSERAKQSLESALKFQYKLPERSRFSLKANYFHLVEQDVERAIAVTRMHTELFPDDLDGLRQLAGFYELTTDTERAIATHERILELDPQQTGHLQHIGRLYAQRGDYQKALDRYRSYANLHPDDYRSFTVIGDLYSTMGEHQRARAQYENALLLASDNASIFIQLARSDFNLGNFTRSENEYQQALAVVKTPEQRAAVYEAMISFLELRGKMGQAVELTETRQREMAEYQPPLSFLLSKLNSLDTYVRAGRTDTAFSILRELETQLSPPFDAFIPFGYSQIYLELEEADELEAALEGLQGAIENLGFSSLRPYSIHARGKIFELRGEYDQAIITYQRALQLDPTAASIHIDIGRCYRKLNQLEAAQESLIHTLQLQPYRPEAQHEMARILTAAGEPERARAHLETALRVWSDADPGYEPAREARAEFEELIERP